VQLPIMEALARLVKQPLGRASGWDACAGTAKAMPAEGYA
jgi:hypothetical protein